MGALENLEHPASNIAQALSLDDITSMAASIALSLFI